LKKIALIIMSLLMASSVAMASPLTDYSKSETSLDLTFRNSEIDETRPSDDYSFGKKSTMDATITHSLGNGTAIQYRHFSPNITKSIYTMKVATDEFNYIRKLDNHVAVFAGLINTKQTYTHSSGFWDSTSTGTQIGVIGNTTIAPKTTLWGILAVGANSMTNFEAGIGYQIAPNLEFNVNYRQLKLDFMYGYESKVKGTGFGVTYKF